MSGRTVGRHKTGALPATAVAYIATLTAITLGMTATLVTRDGIHRDSLPRFAALSAAAAVAQLFGVRVARNQEYHVAIVFLLAAALLLPAALLPLVAVVQHLPGLAKRVEPLRYSVFNTLNHALNMLAAGGIAKLVLSGAPDGATRTWALAGGLAALTLVFTNHALLAGIMRLTRGDSLRETRLFAVEPIAADLAPAVLGVALAAFWQWAPWLLPSTIVPLVLVHRSLVVLRQHLQPADAR